MSAIPVAPPSPSAGRARSAPGGDHSAWHGRFKRSPSVYVYRGVSEEVFDRLMASPSKGTFINREIKNVYTFHIG